MFIPYRSLKRLLCATALLIFGIGTAIAQPYPNKPIRFLVGFTAGSSIDTVARVVAAHVSRKLGEPVVVENRTGANGMLAAAELARAQADGYTVLISNSSTITVNPTLYRKNVQYDVEKDFAPVSLMVSAPLILTINPDNERTASVSTLGDLITLARNKPDQLSFGSAGLGNLQQLIFEKINRMAGVRMVHVPYRGTPLAQMGLLAKEIDANFEVPAAVVQIKAGKLKALAVSSAQRWRDLPDVPSIAELGYPDFDISYWLGAIVHAQTPRAVVKILYDAIKSAGEDPATRALLVPHGNIVMLEPEQFSARIKAETEQFANIIKQANIQVE